MLSLPVRAYRKIHHRILKSRRRRFDAEILDQQVPLQSLCRTVFDHHVHWFGEAEFYDPPASLGERAGRLRMLGLQAVPQAMPRPYYFYVENALISARDVIDPQRPRRAMLEIYPDLTQPKEGKNWYFNPPERMRKVRSAAQLAPRFQEAFIFSDVTWRFYYHFLMDSCLRFVDLEQAGALGPRTAILYYDAPNRWQAEYLDLLGLTVSPDRVLSGGPKDVVKVGRLIVGSSRRNRFLCSRKSIERFRDRLFDRLGIAAGRRGHRRIFISRAAATTRRMLNEPEVIRYLEGRGFEAVTLETLPVADQIRMFAEAEVIVAPHGSGLANMIYASRPRIIELLPIDGWYLGYFVNLAHHLGFDYVPIVSAPAPPGDYLGNEIKFADFSVDLEQLKLVI